MVTTTDAGADPFSSKGVARIERLDAMINRTIKQGLIGNGEVGKETAAGLSAGAPAASRKLTDISA